MGLLEVVEAEEAAGGEVVGLGLEEIVFIAFEENGEGGDGAGELAIFDGGLGVGPPDEGFCFGGFGEVDGMGEVFPGAAVVFLFGSDLHADPAEDVAADLVERVVGEESIEFRFEGGEILEGVVGEGEVDGGFAAEQFGVGEAGFFEVWDAFLEFVEAEEGPAGPELRGGFILGAAVWEVGGEVAVAIEEGLEFIGVLVEGGFLGPGVFGEGGVAVVGDEAFVVAEGGFAVAGGGVGVGAFGEEGGDALVGGVVGEKGLDGGEGLL